MDKYTKSSSINWFVFLILGLIVISLSLTFYRWAYDDPFISYRYAENLTRGLGFVYNPGERILSTTTPLFTILLALVGLVSSEFHLVATGIGIISLAIGGLFIFDLARTYETPLVGWAGLLLYPTFPLVVSTLGSETPIYLAFCLGAFTFYARENLLAAGIFGVLATLTRPDGILVLGILGVDYLISWRKPIPWKPILVSGAILAAWFGFAWLYFGSPIPVTLVAKQQQGSMAISELFAQGLVTIIKGYRSWPYFLEAILAMLGVILAVWKNRLWLIILIWPVLYFISYSILGVSRYFWYYAPLIPGFIVVVGLGLTAISELISNVKSEKKNLSSFGLITSGILLMILLAANGISLWRLSNRNDPRFGIYKAAGEWLRENTHPDEQVGSLEVGIVGFYAQRPMVDFAGLIQPDVAEQFSLNTTYEDAAFWAVENITPEYLVLHDGLFNQFEQEYAKPNCVDVKRLKGEQYSYNFDLTIYDCRQ
jgi:hypothetical protein